MQKLIIYPSESSVVWKLGKRWKDSFCFSAVALLVEMKSDIEKLSMIWARVWVYFMWWMSLHFPAMYINSHIAKHTF